MKSYIKLTLEYDMFFVFKKSGVNALLCTVQSIEISSLEIWPKVLKISKLKDKLFLSLPPVRNDL